MSEPTQVLDLAPNLRITTPQGSATPLLELVEVTKVYDLGEVQVTALDKVSFTVRSGEYVAIMGQSGSGKSTLMHILGCLDVPTTGTYRLEGSDVGKMDEVELAHIRNKKIGFVFQQFHLLPRLSAWRNVELPLLYTGIRSHSERRRLAEQALDAVGLADRRLHRPTQLSGGQQQRVAIARALVTDPSIILADEPTGALASDQSEEVMAIFEHMHRDGRTIILITHEADIGAHARRIVRLRDGHIVDDHSVDKELFQQ
ncbi:MAG: ABC transporter ATP-binding protein [Actinobacteria bacterium]|nr:ABC transporter ATP-binding protein [Actinomycetota bacterium]